MNMYSIVELDNEKFQCICRIQDGVERWSAKSREEAVLSLINGAKVMNGTRIAEKDIYFEAHIPPTSAELDTITQAVDAEYRRAASLHGPFSSTHEGYAIIKEEVDELWDGIKKNDDIKLLKEEAIQIAAMAIRFCMDI